MDAGPRLDCFTRTVHFECTAMARLKSDSVKWTVALVLVVFSNIVYSRPQVEVSSTTLSVASISTNNPTETTIRYASSRDNIPRFKLSLQKNISNSLFNNIFSLSNSFDVVNPKVVTSNRTSRLIPRKTIIRPINQAQKKNNEKNENYNPFREPTIEKRNLYSHRSTNIKKVITKWVDNVQAEDLDNISHESSISSETDSIHFANLLNVNVDHEPNPDTINNLDESIKNQQYIDSTDKKVTYSFNRPRPHYSEETEVYSDGFHLMNNLYATRPTYIFTTPTPTPIITNVGYPKPWPQFIRPQIKPTTRRPIKSTTVKYSHNYHNSVNNYLPYPGSNFDVTTFPPAGTFTDRIVIRPEEYSADPNECPTIFLTLNNTFQAKEACPDLNIAVNTNVINKNVVIESDEDTDTTLTDVFGLPIDDESESDEVPNDYAESQENDDDETESDDEESDSASVEGLELSGYNAANSVDAESSEPGSFASPSSALSTYSRPIRPSNDDDDGFSFSSLIDFFRPAVGAFSWLAAINPFSFGAISFFITPIILLFAGASGLATLFAPFALSGREAPETFIYRPKWQWDDNYKTWYLESFPDNRKWVDQSRKSTKNQKYFSIRSTWLENVKDFLKRLTENLRNNKSKIKRKKDKHLNFNS